ncbi:MAG: hypothetical protein FJY79_05120 [Candidatus Aminicenantes bacterium]|nr:hypothetical protein [Candidatus Aminicenantes bacterium]
MNGPPLGWISELKKGVKFWLGKLVENPEIMSQGRTIKELIENIKDAYYLSDARGFSSRSWKS